MNVISIHALREEGDIKYQAIYGDLKLFQSTPSARRATGPRGFEREERQISIHALREEGDRRRRLSISYPLMISIHALREEGDARDLALRVMRLIISIHALREEGDRTGFPLSRICSRISIHALREEGDRQLVNGRVRLALFQSTPSARRATGTGVKVACASLFQSTPSARRATKYAFDGLAELKISIHALREEGD